MKDFIGRKADIQKLQDLYDSKSTKLAVIKGRRRIGKSRLVTEFAKNKRFFNFTGFAPVEGVTLQTQLDHFGRQLAAHLNIPPITFGDWSDALASLAHYIDNTGTVILFDEISWMATGDPSFVPKLKAWWDTVLSLKPHVLLVFCSSVSMWIENNILNNTAFFGRVSLTLTLEPLSIPESAFLLRTLGFKGSPYEIYKLLSILGGIPWYLEHVNHKYMADENIKNLCFNKDGLLVLEFERIFHDLFVKNTDKYKKILTMLKEGMRTLSEIRTGIAYSSSGNLTTMMENLITSMFVSKEYQWSMKTANSHKQNLYRISDPYMRFYLKNIEPNRLRIDKGEYKNLEINQIVGFDTHIGLQIELLLLQNRLLLLESIGIQPGECLFDGPYRQNKTARHKGCQIDYLVQTRSKNIFLCEFKFKRRELGSEVIDEVRERMNRLSVPRGFAVVPVLFHIGGVSEAVCDKNFFYRIIDIQDFIQV